MNFYSLRGAFWESLWDYDRELAKKIGNNSDSIVRYYSDGLAREDRVSISGIEVKNLCSIYKNKHIHNNGKSIWLKEIWRDAYILGVSLVDHTGAAEVSLDTMFPISKNEIERVRLKFPEIKVYAENVKKRVSVCCADQKEDEE